MEKFNSWTAYEMIGGKRRCVCECGNERFVTNSDLSRGKSKRCNECAQKIRAAAAGNANRRHGMDGTPEYRTWTDMRRRCHQPQRPDYKSYGARGIYVCQEWRESFETFFRDMGPRPPGHTLERKDNQGPYAAANCKWVPRAEQERNKKSNVIISVHGESMPIIAAAEKYGVPGPLLYSRVRRGWDGDAAVFTKPRPRKGPHGRS